MKNQEILDDWGPEENVPRSFDRLFQYIATIHPARQIGLSVFYSFCLYALIVFKSTDSPDNSEDYSILLGAISFPFIITAVIIGIQKLIFMSWKALFNFQPKPARISFTGLAMCVSFIIALILAVLAIFIP